jgi:hypothetical protein
VVLLDVVLLGVLVLDVVLLGVLVLDVVLLGVLVLVLGVRMDVPLTVRKHLI